MNNHRLLFATTSVAAVLTLVAIVYSPVTHSGFVWDDAASFRDEDWLLGNAWQEHIWRGFNGWINYFRPLALLSFTAQVHLFDSTPGPMHLVSLGLHLINTLLVGMLALHLPLDSSRLHPAWRCGIPMLFYGLHPALIETTAWIGCQFELTTTLFTLLGLLFNATVKATWVRAVCVGLAFFLAACCKEAAMAMPLLTLLFDLACARGVGWKQRIRNVWFRQRAVYGAVLLGSVAYLLLRYWGLGYFVIQTATEPLLSFDRLQEISLTFLSYWRLILWPMSNLGLIHAVDEKSFASISPYMLAVDVAAIALMLFGLYAYWKHWVVGLAVLAVSAALLPVVNLIPIGFNEGLYHDRYATMAIAVFCPLLPALLAPFSLLTRWARAIMLLTALMWLGLALANIRLTLPLWADELALWQWAARQEPDAVTPKDHLLSTYIGRNDHARGRELADWLVANHPECVNCMLNAANLAVADHDPARAALALGKVKDRNLLAYNKGMLEGYVFANGELSELQGDLSGAEEAYRDAITLDPASPVARFTLALLLVKTGRAGEGKATADAALSLFAPDERELRRVQLAQALAQAGASR